MRGLRLLLHLALLMGLSACGNLFSNRLTFGGPTVLASVPSKNEEVLRDQNGNVVGYRYTYTLQVYALPGSGAGTVEFLDGNGNGVGLSILVPERCPPTRTDPCGPYSTQRTLESPVRLSPITVTHYRSVSANGQSKVVRLDNPIQIY